MGRHRNDAIRVHEVTCYGCVMIFDSFELGTWSPMRQLLAKQT